MGEIAGPGGSKAQHLKAVRQRAWMTALAAIFDVVVDRMIIARHGLERGEIGVRDGAARDVEGFARRQVLEIPALRKPVPGAVEFLAHGRNSAFSATSPAIAFRSRPSPAKIC